ncbi:hypothetical protein BDK92_0842 [Micromonospora pisi]|uniref:Uncharacterized protein n=1 Tax=Micromonospora pisi TaxID=589240 RepID=A0A495JC73_9ACTN|nr:DUF6220 domain-containing protein [Micromonospora pisi]RKR86606.1 hypothetical protein BDK92_0842 [Micromonospora pisi]
MRKILVITSALVLVVVLAQFYLAGVGAFSRPPTEDAWMAHRAGAAAIMALAVVNTIVAALARAGGRTIAFAALPIGLVIVQFVLSAMSSALGGSTIDRTGLPLYLVALHVVNGLAVLSIAIRGLLNARRLAIRAADEPASGPQRAHAE